MCFQSLNQSLMMFWRYFTQKIYINVWKCQAIFVGFLKISMSHIGTIYRREILQDRHFGARLILPPGVVT